MTPKLLEHAPSPLTATTRPSCHAEMNELTASGNLEEAVRSTVASGPNGARPITSKTYPISMPESSNICYFKLVAGESSTAAR